MTLTAAPGDRTVSGQLVTVTATMISGSITSAPTGAVQFALDGSPVGDPVALDGDGGARRSFETLAAGDHVVTATYLPSRGAFEATAPRTVAHTVAKADTTVAVTREPNASVAGQPVTFTVRVRAESPGARRPDRHRMDRPGWWGAARPTAGRQWRRRL